MGTDIMNTVAVNCFLSTCSLGHINFTIKSNALEIGQDDIFITKGLVLSWCKAAGLCIKISMHVKSYSHRLTHEVKGYSWLASIPSVDSHRLFAFGRKILSTLAPRVNTIDVPTMSSLMSYHKFSSTSVNEKVFLSLNFCRQILPELTKLRPRFNLSNFFDVKMQLTFALPA